MKITEDVRKYAAEQKISEEEALQVGLEQKATEFTEAALKSTQRRNVGEHTRLAGWCSALAIRTFS